RWNGHRQPSDFILLRTPSASARSCDTAISPWTQCCFRIPICRKARERAEQPGITEVESRIIKTRCESGSDGTCFLVGRESPAHDVAEQVSRQTESVSCEGQAALRQLTHKPRHQPR